MYSIFKDFFNICFFTELSTINFSSNIDHFKPQNKIRDSIFDWNNLYYVNKAWNETVKRDQWKDYWTKLSQDFDKYFLYIKFDSDKTILLEPSLQHSQQEIDEVKIMIYDLQMNTFEPRSATNLARMRYSYYKSFKDSLEYSDSFPSIYNFVRGQ